MLDGILVKNYTPAPFDKREILRYAGCKEGNEGLDALLSECLAESEKVFSYRVCFRTLRIEDFFRIFGGESEGLFKRLCGCEYAVIFAATVGLEIDRLMMKYESVAVTKGLFLQAIGTERIESLCEAFCEDIAAQAKEKGYFSRPRFSAGYGDFPLEKQREFFTLLDCGRTIGVSLTDSLLMTPTKSVTAVIGLGKTEKEYKTDCAACGKTDCTARIE